MSATADSRYVIRNMTALLLSIAAFAFASKAKCDGPQETPAQLVDDLHSAFGAHHARAVTTRAVGDAPWEGGQS